MDLMKMIREGVKQDRHHLGHKVYTKKMLVSAVMKSFYKLDPRDQFRNPVMFIVEIGCIITTISLLYILFSGGNILFNLLISLWLWLTLIFANFSEALAEGKGKAQAEYLRKIRTDKPVRKLTDEWEPALGRPSDKVLGAVNANDIRLGDLYFVSEGDLIAMDGEIVLGAASVDESAITGESAPVIRESGGDRSAVTGGTKLLSDWLVIRVTADSGHGFLDRMIGLIEGARRKKTPNEIALNTLLVGLTVIFLIVCISLFFLSDYSASTSGKGERINVTILVALLVCLAPTTIGGLLSAIGIAGMDRLIDKNVIAFSGQAIEAAGDVDVLLLDKTGTITLGNRHAVELVPVDGTDEIELARVVQLSSVADETPEGRSILVLVKNLYGLRGIDLEKTGNTAGSGKDAQGQRPAFIPFSAQTKMSGVDIGEARYRKGASDAMFELIVSSGFPISTQLQGTVTRISRSGGTPLVVTANGKPLGVIHLKDIVKGGMKEKFQQMRKMGIKTVMITGDNHVTAASIAAEAGVDSFLAEAKPEDKLDLIRKYQSEGLTVAMMGDGTNDAPALAQAEVAVAMNTGTQPAREASNMVDLDSNPSKLLDIVATGKQLLMTRGALTTFSITNDIAKYFVILPAVFTSTYPVLENLDLMRLQSPITSAVVFNALIIIALVPLAMKGVKYMPMTAQQALGRNLLIYGLGGIIVPFIGIKLIDIVLSILLFGRIGM
jgi:K+-transporting ATPase ATPase B chain